MENQFFYPITLRSGSIVVPNFVCEFKGFLPVGLGVSALSATVLTSDAGVQVAGLYMWSGTAWIFLVPYEKICESIIYGAQITAARQLTTEVDFSDPSKVVDLYRNGTLYNEADHTDGLASVFWGVVATPIGGGSGTVTSVNGQSPDMNGNVVLVTEDTSNASGTSLISENGSTGTTKIRRLVGGSNVDLALDANGNLVINGDAAPYVLPPAGTTAATIGGVYVTSTTSGLTLGPDGALSVNIASPTFRGGIRVDNQLFSISNEFLTIARASATQPGIVQIGANINVDAQGVISVAAPYVLPAATAATLGGVKAGTNVTIAPDGTISASGAVQSVSGQTGAVVIQTTNNNAATGLSLISDTGATTGNAKLKTLVAGATIVLSSDANGNVVIGSTATSGAITAVQSEGTGTSLVDNDGTAGGVAILKSIAAGSNITITPAGDGKTLTVAANQVLQPATTTTIGGVIVKTGLSVDGSGNLSLAAPVGVNIGGVKAGSGVTIAADGTISASGAVTSVSNQTGVVVISATNTSTASGVSLITSSGSTTGTIVLRQIVAGTGVTLATDTNGNLQINSSASGGVTSIGADSTTPATGAITLTSGTSISLAQTGSTIQINGTGVPEAPNNSNVYARGQGTWVVVPNAASAITSVTGQTGTNAVLLVEANPPANSAIIKSLVAGTNVTITESGGLVTITAALPAGTVGSVNNKTPNSSGNVTLVASDVAALPLAGGTMSGAINMATNSITGLPNPVNPTDAVNYQTLQNMAIDGGVIG